ncbi:hypothetical protein BpHYR1_035279 [Brachionus plicatilis]|uniref:Uncharacterized protein n=1 Tax=Brachionus plicatilis TaxID=10195 RepID=A0A3M7PYC0_BRAPC|nr:hypothetical protein BpHYR1_035279 [Brachionus plicatilis]
MNEDCGINENRGINICVGIIVGCGKNTCGGNVDSDTQLVVLCENIRIFAQSCLISSTSEQAFCIGDSGFDIGPLVSFQIYGSLRYKKKSEKY